MEELIIDWEQSAKIAGNNLLAAKEFLALLCKNLLNDLQSIQLAYDENNLLDMKRQIHALHGALCYCSVPRLKNATIALEKALQIPGGDVPHLFSQFKNEITKVIIKFQE